MKRDKKTSKKPYISFVVVGRNDNYGHRFLYRVQNFINNILYLSKKEKLHCEIVFVEWNPPKGKRLWQDLKFSKEKNEFCKIRFIEVPEKIHNTIENSDRHKLFEFIGKNAGIRRSEGDFVLVTNPDIIFNDEIIKYFSKKKLDKIFFYRTARYNLYKDVPEGLNPKEVVKFSKKNWIMKNGVFFKGFNLKNMDKKSIKDFLNSRIRNFGRFIFMLLSNNHRRLWYHGGTPGDFILMSKDSWDKIKGFPEFAVRVGGIDGYGTILAAASGLKMVNLKSPKRIYHQYHYRAPEGRNTFDNSDYIKKAEKMLKEKRMIQPNNSNWGLNDKKFKEKVI